MASKLYPPLLEASIPAFYEKKVIIPFKHNPLVSKADYTGFKVEVKRISGELINIYDGTVNEENNTIVCTIRYNDLFTSYSDSLSDEAKEKLLQANWYKFSIAYISKENNEVGYYSTAAIGRFLGPKAPTVTLTISSSQCKAIYSHPYDKAEKAYSYRFILKKVDVNSGFESLIEDTGEMIHNINEDTKANESIDIFEFKYYIPPNNENDEYKLTYILTTINGFIIKERISISQTLLSGVPLTSINEKETFEIEAICNRDNGTIDLWAYPNTNLESITGWFKVWRSSSKDDYIRMQLVSTFALIETKTRKDGEPIKILLTTDNTVEAGYYYRYFIQRYNQYGINSEVISVMKNGKAVYMSYDDCFLWDGKRQLRIKFNPKISSFKTNILQSKSETIGSKYPFITRNGVVNYKEFPISGLISFQMDENELFMTKEEKERLGILPDLSMRGELEYKYDGKDSIRIAEYNRHRRKHFETETPWNLVDINVNAEKDFKLMVLDFLNSNKPKLFRSATEGIYVVYTMNSSLTPTDSLGRMLHTFNCTAYECESVEDFCNRYINDTIYCYTNRDNFINLLDLSNLVPYQKVRHIPYLPKSVLNEENEVQAEEILNAMIDQRLLDIDEYAKNFFIRDAKPLQEFKISFVDLYHPTNKIPDQTITIGATGSYNYFSTDTNIYIKYIWPVFNKEDIGLTHPATITFRDVIRIPITDFDFLEQTGAGNKLAVTLRLQEKYNKNYAWENRWIIYSGDDRFKNIWNLKANDATQIEKSESRQVETLIRKFAYIVPLSLYVNSFFCNGNFTRIENIIEDVKLLRVFNNDKLYDHQAVFTLGNGHRIYEQLVELFTRDFKNKDNLSELFYKLFNNNNPDQLLSTINNLETEYNCTYQVSKEFYQFCKEQKIGRLFNEDIREHNIFIFKQMKIEDRVKYMSKRGNANSFVYYDLTIDFESNMDKTLREFISLLWNILIQIFTKIENHKTTRLIPPQNTMVLGAEVPNVMNFCIWRSNTSEKYNEKILYELTAKVRQNIYNFNDVKKAWEVYKGNVI